MSPATQVIDTKDLVRDVVDEIYNRDTQPLIFIDQEGQDLGRHGTIAIMQILAPPDPTVYLLDIHVLGRRAFDTSGTCNLTWANILESVQYVKVFFDVRNDSDALFNNFQIDLHGIIDVQLLELASRPGQGRFLKGLAKCISENSSISLRQYLEWRKTKNDGALMFTPEKGGSYEVFEQRPLSSTIKQYCAEDVLQLPALLKAYAPRVSRLADKIAEETLNRVAVARDPTFDGRGKHMAIAPSFTRAVAGSRYKPIFPMSLICSSEIDGLCALYEAAPEMAKALRANEGSAPVTDYQTQSSSLSHTTSTLHKKPEETVEASSQRKQREVQVKAGSRSDATRISLGRSADDSDHDSDPDRHSNHDLDYEQCVSHSPDRDWQSSYSDEERTGDDFAACSLDDCGYCGRCMY